MATLMANGGRALSATRGGLARGTGATAVTPGAVAVPRLNRARRVETVRTRVATVRVSTFGWCSTGATCDVGMEGRHARVRASSSYVANAAGDEDKDADESEEASAPRYESSSALATKMEEAGDAVAAYLNEALKTWEPPKFLWRTLYTMLLLGLVVKRVVFQRKLNMQQTLQQIARVGPDTLGVAMLTSSFVGMVFTIQFCKEFSKVGLTRVIGGLLGLAFTRELTPVICAIGLAGRVGSAIAAELGTMQVSEQVDQLRTLGSDPVDYLVAPRVVACAVSLPILSVISFTIGMAASILLADLRYDISPNAIVDSAAKYLESSDIGIMCAKALAFGAVIATISCGWGQTTTGGAKGVGESTTASVVISLVAIFVVDFALSLFFFNK